MLTHEPLVPEDAEIAPLPSRLASLYVLGLNHHSASAAMRSSVSVQDHEARTLIRRVRELGCEESLVLSTCNRTEVYFRGGSFELVLASIGELCPASPDILRQACYRLEGRETVTHLFKVACGLDSAVLGEHEILGQLKKAYSLAKSEEALSGPLDRLVQKSFAVGKRVRSETDLSRGVTSVASVAMRKAAKLAGGLDDKSVLIIGAGQVGERVAKSVSRMKTESAVICNRTSERAAKLAKLYGLESASFEDIEVQLSSADVIVGAISSSVPILSLSHIAEARKGLPTVVVDLGVPPNFSVEVERGALSGIQVLDMDGITGVCGRNSDDRQAAVPRANEIVTEEVIAFEIEAQERDAAPYIGALSRAMDDIRKRNLEWALSQAPPLGARERKLLEDLSIRLVRGLMERPIEALKNDLREPFERAVVARLFARGAPQE